MISWPIMILPPINLHTVPRLEKRDQMEERMKVLFVGAQGRVRSATAMHLMNRLYGYDTRSCGVDNDALIPLSPELVEWADEIVVMEQCMVKPVRSTTEQSFRSAMRIKCLDIPDEYEYMDEELCQLIQRRYFR